MEISQKNQLEQGRAAYAYECAEKGAKLDKRKEYKAYVKKIPMMIKTNGLGAAMAFAFAKGSRSGNPQDKDAWGVLYTQIEEWLRRDEKELISFENNRLAYQLTKVDSSIYRAVTVEVLALLTWMKRFTEALIEGESSDN